MYPVFISVVSIAVCLISLYKLFWALYTKTRPLFFILLLWKQPEQLIILQRSYSVIITEFAQEFRKLYFASERRNKFSNVS